MSRVLVILVGCLAWSFALVSTGHAQVDPFFKGKQIKIVVGFTADRVQLDQSSLRVMAPFTDGGAGGTEYRLRVKDFVELKKDR